MLTLNDLISRIQPDAQAVADGRRRMTDIWHGRATDSLPILFAATPPADCAPFNMRRHVEDDAQMLYDTVVGLVATARAGSDAQLSLRADTGTGTLATAAGCGQLLSDVSLPWTTHVTRAQVEAFDPSDHLADRGVLPRVQALCAYFAAHLPACVHGFCADTQSPFDLAHLLYGDELFYALYDEPAFVHELMEKCTTLYIEGTKLLKAWIHEPLDGGCHFNTALANGGVRACNDTVTLLSPDAIAEFVMPYEQRALAAFGGGFVHYCGDNAALYAEELAAPYTRGLNFGNPERYDFGEVIPQLIAAGKCYMGTINRLDDESLDTYFRRVISYTTGARKGLILTPELRPDETAEPRRVLELWRGLQ